MGREVASFVYVEHVTNKSPVLNSARLQREEEVLTKTQLDDLSDLWKRRRHCVKGDTLVPCDGHKVPAPLKPVTDWHNWLEIESQTFEFLLGSITFFCFDILTSQSFDCSQLFGLFHSSQQLYILLKKVISPIPFLTRPTMDSKGDYRRRSDSRDRYDSRGRADDQGSFRREDQWRDTGKGRDEERYRERRDVEDYKKGGGREDEKTDSRRRRERSRSRSPRRRSRSHSRSRDDGKEKEKDSRHRSSRRRSRSRSRSSRSDSSSGSDSEDSRDRKHRKKHKKSKSKDKDGKDSKGRDKEERRKIRQERKDKKERVRLAPLHH